MKKKNLTALIIDSDRPQADFFEKNIKDLFHKIYYQADPVLALKEMKELNSNVLFINLGIKQRSQQFSFLEALPALGIQNLVIFGYHDSFDRDLLTNSLELGIQDVFVRPYDGDIISTKLTRHFQNEVIQDRDLNYTRLSPAVKARVKFKVKISSVDENGITFSSDHFISKGTVFPATGDIIKEIFETDTIELMVGQTWTLEQHQQFYFSAETVENKEHSGSLLRKFILSKKS